MRRKKDMPEPHRRIYAAGVYPSARLRLRFGQEVALGTETPKAGKSFRPLVNVLRRERLSLDIELLRMQAGIALDEDVFANQFLKF
jgi:hypothetical protein